MAALLNSLALLLVVASAGINCQGGPWEFTSPNFPEFYSNDLDWERDILITPGSQVRLQFCEVDIEDCCDFIEVDGTRYSEEDLRRNDRHFDSNGTKITVSFTSDGSSTGKGFRVRYAAVGSTNRSECDDAGTCQNGGTCVDEGLCGPQCSCPPGVSGDNCQYVEVACLSIAPCQNGGACNPYGGGCTCSGGYTGDSCEIPPPCCTEPCKNGGTCIHSVSYACNDRNFTCVCAPSFSGPTCEDSPGSPAMVIGDNSQDETLSLA